MKTFASGLALVAVLTSGPTAAGHAASAVKFSAQCAAPTPGMAACDALAAVRGDGSLATTATPSGYGPADLQSAYFPRSRDLGEGQVVAVVDAYDDPNAEADLAVYRAQYGLIPCTSQNGCFVKVDEHGGTHYPKPDVGWAREISLDLDMVSASCPYCHILLVEAQGDQMSELGAAVDTAVRLDAVAVSNSYGGPEYQSEVNDQRHFDHPGVAITASAGDNGYGVQFPAASEYVTAVGGTSLTRANNARGWTETIWGGTGSGCSMFIAKPAWQIDLGCGKRSVVDVSAIADPVPGVAVYDSFPAGGWATFGGTSIGAPLIAAAYALGKNGGDNMSSQYLYSHSSELNDITVGSNGYCDTYYLCNGAPGYDGPSGLGSPNGIGAF